MTRKPIKQLLGFYVPSFFAIHCAVGNSPEEMVVGDEKMSVLSHEYLHFLQDVSTPFGLLNLCNLYNQVRYAVRAVYESTESKIQLPIKIDDDTLRSAIHAYDVVDPDNQEYTLRQLSKLNLVFEEERPESIRGISLRRYVLKDPIHSFRYQIGARDVFESMAYIIERDLYGDLNPSPMLPYKTAELLVHSIYPKLEDEQRLISIVCELSLLSSHQVEMFVMILRRLQKAQFLPANDSELINFALNEMQFKNNETGATASLSDSIAYAINLSMEHIHEFLKAPQFFSLWRWTQKVLDSARTERTADPAFITRLLMTADGKSNLVALMKSRIGIPVIINNSNEPFTFDQVGLSDQLLLFPAIEQVVEQLCGKCPGKCDLVPVCKNIVGARLVNYQTSSECTSAPWSKVGEQSLCPFATIWRSWGLGSKEFTKCI